MKSTVLAIAFLLTAISASAQESITVLTWGGEQHLMGADGTYLGCVTCSEYDHRSVHNDYGKYGSQYSHKSINNDYSRWGSRYSGESARNPYAGEPPVVIDPSGYRDSGALSANEYVPNHLKWEQPLLWDALNDDLGIVEEADADDPWGIDW